MDFAMTDEQELLLESVREFCDRYFTEDVIKEMYETGDMPDEIAMRASVLWASPRNTVEFPATRSRSA